MGHRPKRTAISPLAITVLVVALVAMACGDQAPPSGPGSPVPASPGQSVATSDAPASPADPTPAPTPVDASAAFVATISAPDFNAAVTIDGQRTLGSTTSTITGTIEIDAADSHLARTTTTGKAKSTVQALVVDGDRYTMSTPAGMWFDAPDPGIADLARSLAAASVVTDTGVETKDGAQLHHLVITPPGTLAAALDVNRETYTSVTVTMDAWVEEDGTPVVVEIGAGWTQPVKGKPVAASTTMTLRFSPLPPGTRIAAPELVWQWNTSAQFKYRMAYPVGWTFKPGSAKVSDAYYGFDANAVFASRGANRGVSLGELSKSLTRYLPTITSIRSPKLVSNRSARLGPLPARKIEFTYTAAKVRYWAILYVAVKGSRYYVVTYETQRKTTAEDRALAAQFARSFTPR